MIDYLCTKNALTVRVLAYRPQSSVMPPDCLKVVIQAVDKGEVIAEDPLHEETASALDLARELHLMRNEGWETKWRCS